MFLPIHFIKARGKLNFVYRIIYFFIFFSVHSGYGQPTFIISSLSSIDELTRKYPDSAFLILKNNIVVHQKNNDLVSEAVCLQKMGSVLHHSGNYRQAVECLLRADKIFRKLGHKNLLAENLSYLGGVYYNNQQIEEAWVQFREAIDIYQQTHNARGIALVYGQTGHLFEKKRRYDSAFFYQRAALFFAKRAVDEHILWKIYENLGSIHEDLNRLDSARYYFLLSLEGYRKSGDIINQVEVINNLGDIFRKSGDYSNGLLYAGKAMELALLTGEKYQLQSAYRDISQNYTGLKMFDSAYFYLDKSRELIQSIYALENSQQITLLQALYDTDRKNNEIEHLNALRKVDNLVRFGGIAFFILLSMVAFLIFNRQKLKIRNEQEINNSNREVFETQKGLMESELKRQQLEEASLKQQLDIKGRELSSHILHLIQKNEVLEEVKTGLTEIIKDDKRDQKKQLRQLLQKINFSFSQDHYWEDFRLIFDQVHPDFIPNLQKICPELTAGELRLLTLLKMNLGSADMSTLLGITADSLRVTRYRVKKKLKLEQGESLSAFAQSI